MLSWYVVVYLIVGALIGYVYCRKKAEEWEERRIRTRNIIAYKIVQDMRDNRLTHEQALMIAKTLDIEKEFLKMAHSI